MKRKKYMVLVFTTVCCMATAGVLGLKAAAASSNESMGDFSAVENQVVWCSEDITYLNRELDALYSEIGDSISDRDTVESTILDFADKRRNLLTSHGSINYDNGKVVADTANLFTLADKTDALEKAYSTAACHALNNIGTFFNTEGDINHKSQATGSIALNRARIVAGILQSQSVEHLAATPITADNVTAGAAAWVNGKCIIGNGADNKKAYQRGIADGRAENDGEIDIRYTPHTHTGKSGKNPIPDGDVYYSVSNPGGCYVAAGHLHDAAGTCSTKQVKKEEECGCTVQYEEHADGRPCDNCRHSHFGRGGVYPDHCAAPVTRTTTEYDCGNPTNTWEIGCNKKAGQIVSAEVIVRTR